MKPIEHMPTMAALDLPSGLTNGDMALPLPLQAVAFFFQEDIGQHRQHPEAHDGCRAHQLILVQAQFFFAIPLRLLTLKRGHWTIENRLHYVKDVSMGEDRSTVHADSGPKIMAALRNTAISLLRRAGFSTIAARLRYNSGHPQAALHVLSLSF